jgi:hypothetical protein
MQGWDKKAIRRLETLKDCDRVKDGDAEVVRSMWEFYNNPEVHFFTHKQRKLIEKLYNIYFDSNGNPPPTRWPARDLKLLKELKGYVELEEVPSSRKGMAESLVEWCEENLGTSDMITQGRRAIMVEIIDVCKNSGKQRDLYDQLKAKYDSGDVNFGSPAFVDSVLKQFEEKGTWTEIQQEHIEKILNNNEDPED